MLGPVHRRPACPGAPCGPEPVCPRPRPRPPPLRTTPYHTPWAAACSSPQDLGGEDCYKCEQCKTLQRARKHLRTLSLPPILPLHLKRFRYGAAARKGTDRVTFPLTGLSLDAFSSVATGRGGGRGGSAVGGESGGGAAQTTTAVYDLVAVIAHHGASLSSGHYTAYVRGGGGDCWHHVDDSRVAVVSEEAVLASEAYVLFYEKRQEPAHAEHRARVIRSIQQAEASPPSADDVLLSCGWLGRYLATDTPGPVTHSDVLCEHDAVDAMGGGSPGHGAGMEGGAVRSAQACFRRVPRDVWSELTGTFQQKAEPTPPVWRLSECTQCKARRQRQEEERLKEQAEINALDTTDVSSGQTWFLVEAGWLKHWREFCWDGTRSDPPGPVCNWRLYSGGKPRPNLARARDYRGVNYDVWRVFVHRYGGYPVLCRREINLYAPPAPLPPDSF
jgi:hypothetical protein